MNNQSKTVILWFMLVVCMILHFNYHVSELMYGRDIKRPDADGSIPLTVLYIRIVFHFLPLIFTGILMWISKPWLKLANLILSILYTISHIFHFAGEIVRGEDPSQILLLGTTFILSVMLAIASFLWWREGRAGETD